MHANSGSPLAFLQRFAGVRTLIRVPSDNGAKEFPTERHGHCRQIPIDRLTVTQSEAYKFPIDLNKWFYNLSQEQCNSVFFTCENQEEFDDYFGQDPTLTRPDMAD